MHSYWVICNFLNEIGLPILGKRETSLLLHKKEKKKTEGKSVNFHTFPKLYINIKINDLLRFFY